MESRRCVFEALLKLELLIEILIRRKQIRAEFSESRSMELVGSRFAYQAYDAGATALVRGGCVLGLHSDFLYRVFGNLHGWHDRGRIVFRDPNRAAVDHVVD